MLRVRGGVGQSRRVEREVELVGPLETPAVLRLREGNHPTHLRHQLC